MWEPGYNRISGASGFQPIPFEQRFWGKVERPDGEHGCWLWKASTNQDGYGNFCDRGVSKLAHRLSYELANGPIPRGLVLDHLCRNRACVNPAHLEPVTQLVNIRRGVIAAPAALARAATHCKHGHEFNERSTYWDSLGRRHCRICGRERWRAKHRPDLVGSPSRKRKYA